MIEAPRVIVQWNGGEQRTEALLAYRAPGRGTVLRHIAWLDVEGDLDEVRRTMPTLPINLRPGAFRRTS